MKRSTLVGLLVLALSQYACVSTETESSESLAASASDEVCKITEVTGSRFKRRLCYSQAEWDAIDRAHKDKMREIDSQPISQRGN
ncbi:hypothetical protein [Microbulbifer pacificus]|uniref:Entry exclusion lipoprotein TrbK n=1 Tax=Microbulbifer pacificus TaxID=407164 RepID=A0AAU0MXL4_9GAMM|nr:hypothetical protein [Microbulbifer pacificus]WOX04787.1 hypothetical protein R5R33_13705 [Microbulbifer pacificus]